MISHRIAPVGATILAITISVACASAPGAETGSPSSRPADTAGAPAVGVSAPTPAPASTVAPTTTAPMARPVPQPACTTPDDYTGTSMSGTFASRAEPLYAAGSAALRDLGFAVLEHSPPRELVTAPNYAWPAGTESEGWHGTEHPGLEIYLFTRSIADSTQVTIGARALCLVRGPGETTPSATVGTSLEGISALAAMKAFLARLQRAP